MSRAEQRRTTVVSVLRRSPFSQPVILNLVLIVVAGILEPHFFSTATVSIMSDQAIVPIMLASAETIVILGGGIDLSVGAVLSLGSVLAATTPEGVTGAPLILLTVGYLAIGALIGAVNGLIVVLLRVPPLLATLATWSIVKGIALKLLPIEGGSVPPEYTAMVSGSVGGFLPKSLLIITTFLLLWVLLKRSRFGIRLYAIGSDLRAARLTGARTGVLQVAIYSLAGTVALFSGLLRAAHDGSGSPVIGDTYLLPAIAALVIGGTALAGGRGGLVLTALGVLALLLVNQVLLFAGVASNFTPIAQGILLIVVVLVAVRRR